MDPALWELLRVGGPPDEEVEAIVRLNDPAARVPGLRIVARFGSIATCRVPTRQVVEVHDQDDIASLKATRVLGPERSIDVSAYPGEVLASDVRRPPDLSYDGQGVVVGLLDWGFAFANPTFRHAAGRTRLLALWDQRGTDARRRNRYGYGTIHDAAALNAALRTGDPYAAIGYHPAEADARARGAHGSHVSDIAVGNGRGGGPVGVAPAADIVCVHLATEAVSTHPLQNLGDSVRVLEAIDLVRRVASGRPFVVSASVGRHGGPHDGTNLGDLAEEALASDARNLCVHSAGNYRQKGCHSSRRVRGGDLHTMRILTSPQDRTDNEIELWYDEGVRLSVQLATPGGTASPWIALGQKASLTEGGRTVARAYHRERDPQNHANVADIFLVANAPFGEWQLRMRVEEAPAAGAVVHAWIERDDACPSCQARFHADDSSDAVTTSTLANGRAGISVGAVDASDGLVAPFSSEGPTRDGRQKPDCVAPGVAVLAARSPWFGEDDDGLTRRSGTSMAAPHVSGCAALVLEAGRGRLGPGEAREILLSNADSPSAGSDPNRYGLGYLNVERSVAAAERIARRRETPAHRRFLHLTPPETPLMSITDDIRRRVLDVVDDLIGTSSTVTANDMLKTLMRELGGSDASPTARELFRRARSNDDGGQRELGGGATIVARPSQRFDVRVVPGDLLVRASLGEGGPPHVSVIAGPELSRAELAAAGLVAEGDAPGTYAQVVEGGSHPHRLEDRFARRVRDSSMRSAPDQAIVRLLAQPRPSNADTAEWSGGFTPYDRRAPDALDATDTIDDSDGADDPGAADDTGRGPAAISAQQLRRIEEVALNLAKDLVKLDEDRWIASDERQYYGDALISQLKEARKLAKRRGVPAKVRAAAKELVDNLEKAPQFAEQMRERMRKMRSLAGRRLFTHLRLASPVVRVAEHEACRIELGFSTLPTELSAYLTDAGANHVRSFTWTAPRDRFQTAIWEGLFTGAHNQAPKTGTYRINIKAKDAVGTEDLSDLIRIENPANKTVVPRAESENGAKAKTLRFDGSVLSYEDANGRTMTLTAVSGLRPNNPRNPDQKDYTRAGCQFVKDRGPVPAGKYVIKRGSVQSPTLKKSGTTDELVYPSGAKAAAWGPYRAPLSPSGLCGREDFFIHLDVKDDGTAGCIGVQTKDEAKFNLLMKILRSATTDVPLEVVYAPDPGGCYGYCTTCQGGSSGAAPHESAEGDGDGEALEEWAGVAPDPAMWAPLTTDPAWIAAVNAEDAEDVDDADDPGDAFDAESPDDVPRTAVEKARDAIHAATKPRKADMKALLKALRGLTPPQVAELSADRVLIGMFDVELKGTDLTDVGTELARGRVGSMTRAQLAKIIAAPATYPFGVVAGARGRDIMLEHQEAVAATGTGTIHGNACPTPPPAGARGGDCTTYVLDVLTQAFDAKGGLATWRKVMTKARAASGTELKGTEVMAALQAEAGWEAIFWSPDPRSPSDGSSGPPDAYRKVRERGTYYGIKVDVSKSVINYHRTDASATSDLSRLDKLRRLQCGLIAIRGGDHMALMINGSVYEVHLGRPATDPTTIEATPLETFGWLSGVVAAPKGDIQRAWDTP